MGFLIDYSNYVLSLATNTLTDQIRNSFKSTFDSSNIVDASNVFNQVSITLIKSLDANTGYYTYDETINKLEEEYNLLDLSISLGNFSEYKEIFEYLFNLLVNKSQNVPLLEVYKYLKILSDNSTELIKSSMYYAILNALVSHNLILEDISFSNEINKFVNNMNSDDQSIKYHFDVFNYVLNR